MAAEADIHLSEVEVAKSQPVIVRRRLLQNGIAASVLAAPFIAARAQAETSETAKSPVASPSIHSQGASIGAHPYGIPSPYEKDVVRRMTRPATATDGSGYTPLQDLDGYITPNSLFYIRCHAGVPEINPDQHRLLVHGHVARPTIFTMDDIVRLPAASATHFLECAGNTWDWTKPFNKFDHSVQFTHGLVGCCEWTGVKLETVLDAVGVNPEATWILAEGADGAVMDRSVPLHDAIRIGALLAYRQNGERLRPPQGYPLRLLLPGFEGNMNVKWLRRLKLMTGPAYSKEETAYYTDLMPDGKARAFTFVMDAKSVITRPSGTQTLPKPGFFEITGLAWSGRGRIRQVDVSVNGGKDWQKATLTQPVLPKCLTRFRLPWNWDGNAANLQSRAIDETGYVQPTLEALIAERGVNSHYHNNAIQSWEVGTDGRVSNGWI